MRKTITLKHPIMINGESVAEIVVDTDAITSAHYAEADTLRRIAAGSKNFALTLAAEFDFGLHPYIGFAAAVAANPSYSFSDLERVHGADVLAFSAVGRNFLLQSEESQQDNSDEQSENTAEPTTQA
jgi:hypothetical protein